jgi:hypothetical protein
LREPPLMRPAAQSCSICIHPWIHPSKHACMHASTWSCNQDWIIQDKKSHTLPHITMINEMMEDAGKTTRQWK